MTKEKYLLEYPFRKGSAPLLWKLISTTGGLSEWFADDVNEKNNLFTFKWDDSTVQAEKVAGSNLTYVRYKWLDEEDSYYFEMRLEHSEVTGDVVLKITDFADSSDLHSSIELWNTQIEILSRRTGM